MKKISLAARLGAATIAFFAAYSAATAAPARAQVANSPATREWVAHQIRAFNAFSESLSPSQRKLPTTFLLSKPEAAKTRAYLPHLRGGRTLASVGQTHSVLIYGEMTPRIKAAIEREGTLTGFFPKSGVASADLSTSALEHIATATEVKSIVPNFGPYVKRFIPHSTLQAVRSAKSAARGATGAVVSEGDKAHQADQARTTYKATGKGIKVGVISDSVESFKALQNSGELPLDATILPGQAGKGHSEGTAMMEIIHDLAPDAGLEFATASPSPQQMAANILALQKDGCKVIVDDVGYLNESVYQEDVVSAAIRQVTSTGVVYLTSVGNDGNKGFSDSRFTDTPVWDGFFVDGGRDSSGTVIVNDWTSKGDSFNPILAGDAGTNVVFSWADPAGKSTNDYNIYDFDSQFNLVASGKDSKTGDGQPIEFIGGVPKGDSLVVSRSPNAKVLPIRVQLFGGNVNPALSFSFGPTGFGHGVSEFALSIGASPAAQPAGPFTAGPFPGPFTAASQMEYFSSTGPRSLLFTADGTPQNRTIRKPDIVAADGVSCATPGFNPFYGTSAAAPHAAAIAALAWSAQPTATADQIRARMIKGVLDIGKPGFENDSGNGIVMAPLVLKYTDPTPTPTPGGTPTPTPGGTPGPTSTPVPTPVPTAVPSGVIAFSSTTYTVGQTGGQTVISVKRLVAPGQSAAGAVTVKYQTTTGGTAIAGTNYRPVSGTLAWPNGDTITKTFTVPILANAPRGPNKTVFLRIYGLVGKGTLSLTNSTATLTILDSSNGSDTTPPKVAITAPADQARVPNVDRISGTASDTGGSGLSSVALYIQRASDNSYWNGTAWGNPPFALSTTISGGNWTRTAGNPPRTALPDDFLRLVAIAADGAGNQSRAWALIFADPTPPQVVILTPVQGAKLRALTSATGTVSDASSSSTLVLSLQRASDGKYWTGVANTWITAPTPLPVTLDNSGEWSRSTFPTLTGGNYTLSALGTDEVGNTATATSTFTVPSKTPPSGGGA